MLLDQVIDLFFTSRPEMAIGYMRTVVPKVEWVTFVAARQNAPSPVILSTRTRGTVSLAQITVSCVGASSS